MAKALPREVQERVKLAVFEKADAHGYASRGRVENGKFIDDLVDDSEIGGVVKEYVPDGRARTYIKDGILNQYTKAKVKEIHLAADSLVVIKQAYGVDGTFIHSNDGIVVCRSPGDGMVYVIGKGTVLKWETALRKALEFVARSPRYRSGGEHPEICLQLAVINNDITEGDKTQITSALDAVGVKVYFCSA